jgi:hypothetical protein
MWVAREVGCTSAAAVLGCASAAAGVGVCASAAAAVGSEVLKQASAALAELAQ